MRRLCLSLVLGLGSLGLFAGSASAGGWHHGHGPYCGPGVYRAYPAPVVVRSYYPAPYPYVVPAPVVYPAYVPPPSGFAFSNRNFSIWFGH